MGCWSSARGVCLWGLERKSKLSKSLRVKNHYQHFTTPRKSDRPKTESTEQDSASDLTKLTFPSEDMALSVRYMDRQRCVEQFHKPPAAHYQLLLKYGLHWLRATAFCHPPTEAATHKKTSAKRLSPQLRSKGRLKAPCLELSALLGRLPMIILAEWSGCDLLETYCRLLLLSVLLVSSILKHFDFDIDTAFTSANQTSAIT